MEQNKFLEKFNISRDQFKKTKYKWQDLINIKDDYFHLEKDLNQVLDYMISSLRGEKRIKYITGRLKDGDHLLEKIIRKKYEKPNTYITSKNYREKITDLVGVRVLHLFKDDWVSIHDFIISRWRLMEKPICYYREGDFPDKKSKEIFSKRNLRLIKHPDGYRSIHYVIQTEPSKKVLNVEIQVRTIFEDAWSEIDHLIRYPYNIDNTVLAYYLIMFNRLAGQADEMATYLNFLKLYLNEKDREINNLKVKIHNLKIDKKERKKLQKDLSQLSTGRVVVTPGDIDWTKDLKSSENSGYLSVPNDGSLYGSLYGSLKDEGTNHLVVASDEIKKYLANLE